MIKPYPVMAMIEVVEGSWPFPDIFYRPREKRMVEWNSVAGIPGELIVLDGKTYTIVSCSYAS